jgi:antitoxin component YwqK of YwqJK toxin-antitoxin module
MKEQLHNQRDSQGRKQGYWEETEESGPVKGHIIKGHYVDGLREGLWKWYREDDTLREEGHYLDDKRHGLWKWYHDDGTLGSEVHYLDNKRHGLWKTYYKDGVTLWEEGHYLDDMQHGLRKWYHREGTLESCTLYNMGKELFSSPLLILPSWLNLI